MSTSMSIIIDGKNAEIVKKLGSYYFVIFEGEDKETTIPHHVVDAAKAAQKAATNTAVVANVQNNSKEDVQMTNTVTKATVEKVAVEVPVVSGNLLESDAIKAVIMKAVRAGEIRLEQAALKELFSGVDVSSLMWEDTEPGLDDVRVQAYMTMDVVKGNEHAAMIKELELKLDAVKDVVIGDVEEQASRKGTFKINGGLGFEVLSGMNITHIGVHVGKKQYEFKFGAKYVGMVWFVVAGLYKVGAMLKVRENGEYFIEDISQTYEDSKGNERRSYQNKVEDFKSKDASELAARVIGELAAHVLRSRGEVTNINEVYDKFAQGEVVGTVSAFANPEVL
jgi:acyl-CoA synthetase (AMP-forming)/AMP-acid ligase II